MDIDTTLQTDCQLSIIQTQGAMFERLHPHLVKFLQALTQARKVYKGISIDDFYTLMSDPCSKYYDKPISDWMKLNQHLPFPSQPHTNPSNSFALVQSQVGYVAYGGRQGNSSSIGTYQGRVEMSKNQQRRSPVNVHFTYYSAGHGSTEERERLQSSQNQQGFVRSNNQELRMISRDSISKSKLDSISKLGGMAQSKTISIKFLKNFDIERKIDLIQAGRFGINQKLRDSPRNLPNKFPPKDNVQERAHSANHSYGQANNGSPQTPQNPSQQFELSRSASVPINNQTGSYTQEGQAFSSFRNEVNHEKPKKTFIKRASRDHSYGQANNGSPQTPQNPSEQFGLSRSASVPINNQTGSYTQEGQAFSSFRNEVNHEKPKKTFIKRVSKISSNQQEINSSRMSRLPSRQDFAESHNRIETRGRPSTNSNAGENST